eukprot:30953-Chlamydomonas_euryale.AAC.4
MPPSSNPRPATRPGGWIRVPGTTCCRPEQTSTSPVHVLPPCEPMAGAYLLSTGCCSMHLGPKELVEQPESPPYPMGMQRQAQFT